MLIVRNKIIPFKGYKVINICGILFVREGATISDIDINHERIHSRQCWELLIVGFYLIYVLEWIWNYFNYGDAKMAYRLISFEIEAYNNQNKKNYLKNRKRFSMWR